MMKLFTHPWRRPVSGLGALLYYCCLAIIVLSNCSIVSGTSEYSNPHFNGSRRVVTHLMEWKYADVALECERFLGPHGYGAVQLSPVNEHAVLERRPWYERYQPVSYKIITRSGSEEEFRDMVDRCNRAGVRIYVDVVLNHMTGGQKGHGTAGNDYDGNSMNYPGVPFGPMDFHGHESCPTNDLEIHNYDDAIQARNCRLSGLRDLKQSSDYVRQKQIDFLNHLIDIGVAGFRSDASKHQWPGDLEAIYSKLHSLNEKYFPAKSKPFIYHEVIYYGGGGGIKSSEYTKLGRVIEFHYNAEIVRAFRGQNALKSMRNFGQDWGLVSSDDALVMVDSHDLQRGHTGALGQNINFFSPKALKECTAFMLAWPYGVPRVMSSYSWPQTIKNGADVNDWMGPPTGSDGEIVKVVPNADNTCNKEWVCEHRWRQIYDMVAFHNLAGELPVENWWDNGSNQIAFSRGSTAFIAFNWQYNTELVQHLKTGLPAGKYCDLASGNLSNGKCTGKVISVDHESFATIEIAHDAEDGFVAITVGAKLN